MIFLEPVTFVQFEYMDILLSVVVWQSPFDFGDPLMSSSSNMRSTLLTKARKTPYVYDSHLDNCSFDLLHTFRLLLSMQSAI